MSLNITLKRFKFGGTSKKAMKILFTFSLLLFSLHSYSQLEFQKFLNYSQHIETYPISNGLLMKGVSANGMDKAFCKIGENGTLDFQKTYDSNAPLMNSLMDVVSDSVYVHCTISSSNAIQVFKSVNGFLSWKTEFELQVNVASENYLWGLNGIKVLNNGEIAIYGSGQVPIFGGFGIAESPIFALFDASGNLLWSKMYQVVTHNFNPLEIIENSNGDLIFAGIHSRQDQPGLVTINGVASVLIARNTGGIIGSGAVNSYLDPDSEINFGALSKDKLLITKLFNLFGNVQNQSSSLLIQLNDNARFSSAKRIDADNTSFSITLENAIATESENFLFGGLIVEDTTATIQQTVHPFCMKTNSALNTSVWAKKYGLTEEGTIEKGKVCTDNTLLLSGNCDASQSYIWKINAATGSAGCNSEDIAIHINNYNCHDSLFIPQLLYASFFQNGNSLFFIEDSPLSSNVSLTTVCSASASLNEMEEIATNLVYPNPFDATIHIQNPTGQENFILTTALGEVVWQGKAIETMDFSFLSIGNYFLKIYNTNKEEIVLITKIKR